MHGQRDVGAVEPAQAGVVGLDILQQRLVGIDADPAPLLAALLIHVVRVVRIVELDVRRALGQQRFDLLADDRDSGVQHSLSVRVDLVRHARLVAPRNHVGGGGHRHLVGRPADMLPEEPGLVLRKAVPLHELGPDDAAARSRNRGAGRADAAQCRSRDRRLAVHEAVHRFAETCRPPAAALFAVAEDADAGPLLDVENAQHCVVLDLPQGIERDPPVKVGLPGLVDLGGPEEAADLVCAISHPVHSFALGVSLASRWL